MKKNLIIRVILIAGMCWCNTVLLFSQNESPFSLGVDAVSRYVWRGLDFANSPSIQPYASYSLGGFSLGTWGAFSTNDANYQEVDLILGYDYKSVATVFVTDYFFPDGTNANNRFFNYDKETTGHYLEATAGFEGTTDFPVTATLAHFFYGADKDDSWYFELGYTGQTEQFEYNVFMGATPGKGMYLPDGSDGFSVVNIGAKVIKTIPVTANFSLPLSGSLIVNPQSENIFFVIGISL